MGEVTVFGAGAYADKIDRQIGRFSHPGIGWQTDLGFQLHPCPPVGQFVAMSEPFRIDRAGRHGNGDFFRNGRLVRRHDAR